MIINEFPLVSNFLSKIEVKSQEKRTSGLSRNNYTKHASRTIGVQTFVELKRRVDSRGRQRHMVSPFVLTESFEVV